jgi:hypothetical protein
VRKQEHERAEKLEKATKLKEIADMRTKEASEAKKNAAKQKGSPQKTVKQKPQIVE